MAGSLGAEIGKRAKARREQRGLTQDEVAASMRAQGFSWDRTTVAKVERGSRMLAVDEALAICLVLDTGLTSMLPTRGQVEVSTRLTISAKSLREALTIGPSDGITPRRATVRLDDTEQLVDVPALLAALGPVADEIAALLGTAPSATLLAAATKAERGDAEQTAARRLGMNALQVAALALALWGRSLTDEREHRLATQVHPHAPEKGRRAMRGHITRDLLAELTDARRRATESDGAR